MNTAIIIGLVRSLCLIAFSSLLARGVIEQETVEQIAGAIGSLVVIAFSVLAKVKLHKKLEAAQNGGEAAPPPPPPTNPNISVKLMLVGIACLPLMGCTTMLKSDKIVSIKQRTFGILVGANMVDQTPEIKLGLTTTVYQMLPTSTNGPINAPRYFDTFKLGQGINPFSTEIIENTGTGDVEIRTNATGGAIVPKSPMPPASPAPAQRR